MQRYITMQTEAAIRHVVESGPRAKNPLICIFYEGENASEFHLSKE